MSNSEDRATTRIKSRLRQRKCVFKWTLEDFTKYENDKSVYSCCFYLVEDSLGFQVSCCRKDKQLYSELESLQTDTEASIKFTVTITDGMDKIWDTLSGVFEIFSNSGITIVPGVTCCKGEEHETVGENVEIILALEMDEIEMEEIYTLPTPEAFMLDAQTSFSQDIASLFENQIATDVTLRVDEDSVGAHKLILSARSPVFAKMFQQDTAELQSGVVDIEDLEMSTVKELLAFMYSKARYDFDFKTALSLYYAADKYEVVKLREICGSVLVSYLDKDNAGCVLKLADRHGDKELKKRTMTFINFNLKSCIKSDWWMEIMSDRCNSTSELETFIADNH